MISISLCMIVKNEGALLERCLDSLSGLMDEIIIVDTGSSDNTKEIAAKYTDQIYDFPWGHDFSAARNFSFSKASMDYIYAPDADEVLDETNRERFYQMKQSLLPEIDIVQMKYITTQDFNTVLNAKKEYRPKLFKRLRTFTWVDPIHETIQLDPVVYDSNIEILHMPQALHHKRDFSIFQKSFERDGMLTPKVFRMYAKELFLTGEDSDFLTAKELFMYTLQTSVDSEILKDASCVLARIYRMEQNVNEFFKLTLKDMLTTPCAEICCELGEYFLACEDYEEAIMWFYNAAFETESILNVHASGDLPLQRLSDCYNALAEQLHHNSVSDELDRIHLDEYEHMAAEYSRQAEIWTLPEEI